MQDTGSFDQTIDGTLASVSHPSCCRVFDFIFPLRHRILYNGLYIRHFLPIFRVTEYVQVGQCFNSKPGLVKLVPKEVEIHINMKAVCDYLWDQIFRKTWRGDLRHRRLGTTALDCSSAMTGLHCKSSYS